jgi:CDP-diacylglycerol---serine O-phosphatidyltransferase
MKQKYGEIYLLPSFFSLANLFFGYMSVLSCFRGRYSLAAFWIIMAAVSDAFDGLVARSSGAQSEFGVQLDSLADAFSFGGATSLLLYFWGLHPARTIGVFFSFVFLASGILRLARYNILQKTQKSRKYRTGLTVPSASLFMASLVLFHPQPLETKLFAFLFASTIILISFFMVSTIRYRDYLRFNIHQKVNLATGLFMAILIASLIFFPRICFLAVFTFIVFSGPVNLLINPLRKKLQKKPKPDQVHPNHSLGEKKTDL